MKNILTKVKKNKCLVIETLVMLLCSIFNAIVIVNTYYEELHGLMRVLGIVIATAGIFILMVVLLIVLTLALYHLADNEE